MRAELQRARRAVGLDGDGDVDVDMGEGGGEAGEGARLAAFGVWRARGIDLVLVSTVLPNCAIPAAPAQRRRYSTITLAVVVDPWTVKDPFCGVVGR